MAADRTAEATWQGDLGSGTGTVNFVTSGQGGELPMTWASRTARSEGKTSPEELLAGAHAACFSMALSHELAQAGNPPERLDTSATVTFDEVDGGFAVTTSRLSVRGRVPGLDQDAFQKAAEGAKDGCPISGALKGNVDMTVEATLES